MNPIEESLGRLHGRVYGMVQGVGFRYSTVNQARRGNLTGYVRNLNDGSVEVLAEGSITELKSLLSWLNVGPPSAVVRRVEHRLTSYGGNYRNFSVDF